jgi:lysozyme family protein
MILKGAMMKTNYDAAFAKIIGVEGGYQSPEQAIARSDSGGETHFGISKRQYPNLDIKNLTMADAMGIYKRDYWDMVKGDFLPAPLDLFVFDSAVNQGVVSAIIMLQKSIGVAQDGVMGKDTMAKIANASPELAAMFMARRAMRYVGTRSFDLNGTGWMKRLFMIAMG